MTVNDAAGSPQVGLLGPRRSATPGLGDLVTAVRAAVGTQADWRETAQLVAGELRRHLPSPEILTSDQRVGDPETHQSHLLHVEPDGAFALDETGGHLIEAGDNSNNTGDISGFAPPGDIHRVRNVGDGTAISLHIYGTDVSRIGSSVRRYYDLPVRPA